MRLLESRCMVNEFTPHWPLSSRVLVNNIAGLTSYELTSPSFKSNQPSHSWNTAFSKFDLENQRWMLWVRSNFEVTKWVLLPIDQNPFPSKSIDHLIPGIQLFKKKNIIWPWKFKVKVKAEGHIVGPISCWLISLSFHVDRPSFSWDTAFSNFTLKIKGQVHMPMMLHNCRSPSSKSIQWFQRYRFHKFWTSVVANLTIFWSISMPIWGKLICMTMYTYRSRKFHRTLIGVNPKIMHFQQYAFNACLQSAMSLINKCSTLDTKQHMLSSGITLKKQMVCFHHMLQDSAAKS